MKIIVTGGSGKLGRACVGHLVEAGHQVVNFDRTAPSRGNGGTVRVDLSDAGQTLDAVLGVEERFGKADAVLHLAAIPAPGLLPDAETFRHNTAVSFNVFQAARRADIRNLVFASSETVLGLPFDVPPPYVPVDEDYEPRPESAYSMGKVMDETLARHLCRRDPALKIYALRFSNVMDPADYAEFPGFDADAWSRKWNLWGYIDARDGAQAARLALEHGGTGFEAFVIANADTVMRRPNRELLDEVFPGVAEKRAFGPNDTLLSIDKAKRMLGFEPRFSWRNEPAAQNG